jgi:hypothetical protein
MSEFPIELQELINQKSIGGKYLGDKLLEMQRSFPEFNFYWDKPSWLSTGHYLMAEKPVPFKLYNIYGQVKRWFLDVITKAQELEKKGDIESAIWAYETLIEHRYPNYKPYDLLIALYRKNKDVVNEVRVLNHSINFFTALRENQRIYVLSLAKKVWMTEKCQELLNKGEKIHYYGGSFVLYDPVKAMVKWEKRLDSLKLLEE